MKMKKLLLSFFNFSLNLAELGPKCNSEEELCDLMWSRDLANRNVFKNPALENKLSINFDQHAFRTDLFNKIWTGRA